MKRHTHKAGVSRSWVELGARRDNLLRERGRYFETPLDAGIPYPPPLPPVGRMEVNIKPAQAEEFDILLPPFSARGMEVSTRMRRLRFGETRESVAQEEKRFKLARSKKEKKPGAIDIPSMRSGARSPATPGGEIDIARWRSNVMRKHPELAELNERLNPISRADGFSKHFVTPDLFDKRVMYPVILQHFDLCGYEKTSQMLRAEADIRIDSLIEGFSAINTSLLHSLLLYNLQLVERLYDDSVGDREPGLSGDADLMLDIVDTMEEVNIVESQDDNTNIWDIPDDRSKCIIYEEGNGEGASARNIKAATLNELVIQLTNATASDLMMMKTFLMTYRSFTTPHRLLEKLAERYELPKVDETTSSKEKSEYKTIQLRVMNVLKTWVDKHFKDFDNVLSGRLMDFCMSKLERDGHSALSKKIIRLIESQLEDENSNKIDVNKEITDNMPPPVVPRNIFSATLKLNDIDEIEIARQLCLVDDQILSRIQTTELLGLSWTKKQHHNRTQNVRTFIHNFNLLSCWVASEILSKDKVKGRSKKFMRMVKIGEHLMNFQNYNSLMAVLAGLNNSAVHRLKQTKKAVDVKVRETLDEMSNLMASKNNYQVLRENLKKVKLPAIPYLGMFLTDLTFIEEGNRDTVNGGLINFNKRKQVFSVITEIQSYQKAHYDIHPVAQIQNLLKNIQKCDDDTLFNRSLEVEPRM